MATVRPAARTALALGALLALAGPARAGWLNGGYESGTLSGWAAAGDAGAVGASFGVAPREGGYQALLTTASLDGDANTFFGAGAAPAADLERFLGFTPGTLGAGFEGSALKQTFVAAAGDTLRFDYQFLTTEGANVDFAFVGLVGYSVLADTSAATSGSAALLDPVFLEPARGSGWRTFSYTFATGGTYTLGLGVADAGDEFGASALLVDNGRLTSAGGTPNPAPEPSSLTLAALGAAALGLNRARARVRHSA